jgi:hypothetical protein
MPEAVKLIIAIAIHVAIFWPLISLAIDAGRPQ